MDEGERPNPEELLKAIQREEEVSRHGRLKIFLGMAAGVGKTYAMLEAAQRLHQEGTKLAIGVVDTHGRQETAALLKGLHVIPPKHIRYREADFEELDVDEIIRLRPQVVVVDELAHSNVPGSLHPKRWQDVVDIIDQGIDVFTTLNVQHIESLKDVVEKIAGVTIRETVPDRIIETATFIELVDITPSELLQRLKEGRVYLGEQSEIAARHFFQEDRLTALREIILRYAAEKIDHDLKGMVSSVERSDGWKPRERLLVAVSHSPHSQRLIRMTRRLAFSLDAPWLAANINTGVSLDEEDSARLSANLALARDLGAEVVTTDDTDVSSAVERIARQHGVTQIVVGRPPRSRFLSCFQRYPLLERLTKECPDIDIHVIGQTIPSSVFKKGRMSLRLPSRWSPYLLAGCCIAGLSAIFGLFVPPLDYKIVGFLGLLSILALSLFFSQGPIIFASLLYGLIWDLFFVPPVGKTAIPSTQDNVLLLLYLVTGICTGILTDRARKQRELLEKRERSTDALYRIVRDIASALSFKDVLKNVKQRLGSVLGGQCEIIVKKMDDGLDFDQEDSKMGDEKERAAATWVFENNKEAGWSTPTLPSEKKFYIPLKGFSEVVGVLVFHPYGEKTLSLEEKNLIYTVAQSLANYLQRSFTEERNRKVDYVNRVERVYQTVLDVMSSQFESPVTTILNAINEWKIEGTLQESKVGSRYIYRLESSSGGLGRLVENVSAMARLNSGSVQVNRVKNSVKELVAVSCDSVKKSMDGHKLSVHVANDLPLVSFDMSLLKVLVCNLLYNAMEYSPPDSTVEIDARIVEDSLVLSVSDQGKGIPDNMLDAVFEKFFRVPGTSSSGLGLGLSIAKSIAEIHGGILQAENKPHGGACFSLVLPLES